MYFPYLFGRQFELLALRGVAKKLGEKKKITPIIEPVKSKPADLLRALKEIFDADSAAIVIANPLQGDFKDISLTEKKKWFMSIKTEFATNPNLIWGCKITSSTTLAAINTFIAQFPGKIALIHWSEKDTADLDALIKPNAGRITNVYVHPHISSAYRMALSGINVLARNGFNVAERNADYPPVELYDDLNLVYSSKEKMNGYADFTVTGMAFKEGGGQAHAVAIHMSYERPTKDIGINHFVSDTTTIPPSDPNLKIGECLIKLDNYINLNKHILVYSNAAKKFQQIYTSGLPTSLGKLKQYSIEHHLELMHSLL